MKAKHLILDFYDCEESLFDNGKVFDALYNACILAGQTVLDKKMVVFPVQGCSCLLVLAESHASVHTWPELKGLSFDLYSCGNTEKFGLASQYLKAVFKPRHYCEKSFERGSGFIQ